MLLFDLFDLIMAYSHWIIGLFCAIGVLAVLSWLYDNFRSAVLIAKTTLMPYFLPQEGYTLTEKFGSWAVITGATDGIGKEYAKNLASKNVNLVLVSRTESKLRDLCNEIESEFKVKTKYIAADFTQGQELYQRIEQQLAEVPIGILVNNVGMMYDCPDDIHKIPEQLVWDMLNVNIASTTMMTRMVVPGMIKRGKGAIVNVASGSELQPIPYMAVYGASKVYVRNFTLAIQEELAPYGITVQLISPMYVVTKMNNYSKSLMNSGILVPNAETYSKFAVFTLGKTDQTNGFWTHGIQYAFMKMIPERARAKISARMNKRFREEYFEHQAQLKSK